MKLENVKREVKSSGTMEVAKATIKATPKIFDMFANDTYANKPLAIMRELVANGVDAHIAAGKPTVPVEVTLPTPLDPMCVVKDFGIGMAHDFVMGPFMAYTDGSTKDKGDDMIGGFGIGSKSPFAYVDQFTLRVVHDGVLSVYTMFKDEDGIPAIGLQAQTSTDEPNGVEVSFPVEDADMETFRTAAQDALQYFQPLPVVKGGDLKAPDYTYVGKNWAMRPKAGELGVIMGGVRYPVTKRNLSWDLQQDKEIGNLLDYGLDVTLPIGACGVAMSREQLSYVPKTNESIEKGLRAILADVVATFSTFFDKCKTEWEAMVKLMEETGFESYNRSARAKLMLSNARYKTRELKTQFSLYDKDLPGTRAWLVQSKSHRRGNLCPTPKWQTLDDLVAVTPGRIETVIVDDLPDSPKSKAVRKIREFVDTQPQAKDTLILRPGFGKTAKDVIKLLRGAKVVLTSTLPEPATAAKPAAGARPKVRMFTYNGGDDRYTGRPITNLSPSMSKERAVTEIAYANQPAKGIMVVMSSFDLPPDMHARMRTGLIKWDELVFVNTVDAPKIASTFDNFEDVWKKRLAAALSKFPGIEERLAVANITEVQHVYHWIKEGKITTATMSSAQKARPFGRIVSLYEDYVSTLTDDQRKLAPFVTAKLPGNGKQGQLWEEFEKKQKDAYLLWEALSFRRAEHLALFLKNI